MTPEGISRPGPRLDNVQHAPNNQFAPVTLSISSVLDWFFNSIMFYFGPKITAVVRTPATLLTEKRFLHKVLRKLRIPHSITTKRNHVPVFAFKITTMLCLPMFSLNSFPLPSL